MKDRLIAIAQIIGIGALVVAGMRAADWVIPKPESRVVMCFANELDQVEICRNLKELMERAELRKKAQKGVEA